MEVMEIGIEQPLPGINCEQKNEDFKALMDSLPKDMMILNTRAMPSAVAIDEDEINDYQDIDYQPVPTIRGRDFNLALGLSIFNN